MGETLTDKRLTTIILDALPEDMYSTVRMQSIRDPDLELEEIISMTRTIFVHNLERSSVHKRSQESYRKVRNIGRESRTDNVRESAVTLICHNCKKPGHKKKCKQLMEKWDNKSSKGERHKEMVLIPSF